MTLLFIALFYSIASFSQTIYHSRKYQYAIEVPKTFTVKNSVTGSNVDFSAIDHNGSSIVIVVRYCPYGEEILNDFAQMSNEETAQMLNENLHNVKIIKQGLSYLGKNRTHFLRYTHTSTIGDDILYAISYSVVKNGYIFVISATSQLNHIESYEAVFFRTIQSFTF